MKNLNRESKNVEDRRNRNSSGVTKMVSEETRRKISEALKRYYASAGRKLQETEKKIYDRAKKGDILHQFDDYRSSEQANKVLKANLAKRPKEPKRPATTSKEINAEILDNLARKQRADKGVAPERTLKSETAKAGYYLRKGVATISEKARKIKKKLTD